MKRILDWLVPQNPWVVMLPFLGLYISLAATLTDHSVLRRDEVRYWGLATNLTHGHFHNMEGDNFLWSGPGYPAVLAPLVALDVPYWVPKVMNAGIYYVAMVMFFYLLCLYLPKRSAWVASFCMLLYYVPWEDSFGDIMTEALAFCLTITTSYFFCKALKSEQLTWRSMLKPAVFLAWLMLTKVIFGYVVLVCIIGFGFAAIARRKNLKVLAGFRCMVLAMAFCLPYLAYTYAISGKIFYWGNAGGMQLYWMSSPYEDELGDWHYKSLTDHPSLLQHHGAFFASIDSLGPVEKDDAFKHKAIQNIQEHPTKFAKNWAMNCTRILFSYPLSFLKPSLGVFKYVLPHSFLLVFSLLFCWPCLKNHRQVPTEIWCLLFLMATYFCGSSLLSGYARFFFPMVPVLVLWIALCFHQFVRIQFQRERAENVTDENLIEKNVTTV